MITNSDENTAKLESKLEKIENKIDHIIDRVSNIDVTIAVQAESLKEHMKRTAILESVVTPLVKHDSQISGVLKLVGLLGITAAIAEGVFSVLSYFKH